MNNDNEGCDNGKTGKNGEGIKIDTKKGVLDIVQSSMLHESGRAQRR